MSRNSRGRKTRDDILDSAWDLISTKGAEVSVSQIATAVGMSRQTVYLHFGSRGGLLIALVRRADQRHEIKEAFDAALALPDPYARLTATLATWLDFVPTIYPVARDLIRLRDSDPEAAAAWDDRMTDLRSWLAVLTRSLNDDGALQDHWTPEAAAAHLWAHSSVQVWGLLTTECGWSPAQAAETITRTLCTDLMRA